MKKFAIFLTLGILVVSVVVLTSLFYFDSTKDYSQSILSNCGPDSQCLSESLTNLSKTEDRETVLTTYSGILRTYQDSACHHFGHKLGLFIYDYTENLAEALSLIDTTCGGSIYHGIMRGYFTANLLSDNGTPTDVVASKACDELGGVFYSETRTTCSHGVGHGLVIAYDYDFLTASEECNVFEERVFQRSCVGGASMEYAGLHDTPEDATFDEDDLLFPCSALDEEFAIPCLHYHSRYILRAVNQSVEDAFEQCEKAKSETLVKHCYYGIGSAGVFKFPFQVEKMVLMCQKGDLNYQTYCFAGAVYSVADQINFKQGFKLCKITPQMFQKDCYNTLGKWIHTIYFTEEEIENACSQLKNTEYYQVCINANPEELGQI